MEHIGLDLHKQSSQFCILTEDKKLLELQIRTEHGRFVELLGKRPKAKVLIEASIESEWVAVFSPHKCPEFERSWKRKFLT